MPYYHVNESALPDDFGQVYETRSDYYQRYLGFEVSATKRMADHWMMRLGFSTNDHREYLKGPGRERGSDARLHDDGRLSRTWTAVR